MKIKLLIIPIISMLGLLISCDKQDDLYAVQNPLGPKIADIISFQSVSSVQLDADSASLCTVKIKINPEAAAKNRVIDFSISSGVFTFGDTEHSITANTEGIASISFISSKVHPVLFKASVSSFSTDTVVFSIDTTILFKPALPDDLLLTADSFVVDSSKSIVITANLFRNTGRGVPTDPCQVFYKITPLDTTVNLVYPEFAFSQNHSASITAINPFKAKGTFTVEAKITTATGNLTKVIKLSIY
jgi:hypothetical protein